MNEIFLKAKKPSSFKNIKISKSMRRRFHKFSKLITEPQKGKLRFFFRKGFKTFKRGHSVKKKGGGADWMGGVFGFAGSSTTITIPHPFQPSRRSSISSQLLSFFSTSKLPSNQRKPGRLRLKRGANRLRGLKRGASRLKGSLADWG